ncbi:MAG: ribonuclease P protein component [Planctomycetota bacterium]
MRRISASQCDASAKNLDTVTGATVAFLFNRESRVRRPGEFTFALLRGGVADYSALVVFAVHSDRPRSGALAPACNPNDGELRPTRLGITIPKRTGNAVLRNRWKRLIREAFRTQPDRFPGGYDLIVRPKKGANPEWKTIRRSLPKLACKAIKRLERTA